MKKIVAHFSYAVCSLDQLSDDEDDEEDNGRSGRTGQMQKPFI